jgi:hypothetical protein
MVSGDEFPASWQLHMLEQWITFYDAEKSDSGGLQGFYDFVSEKTSVGRQFAHGGFVF